MTFDQISKSIKNKKFSPLYLLHGEESFFIDQLVDQIQNEALTEQEKVFNQNVFYGKDAEVKSVMNAYMQYPMMAEYRLILLKEAQHMKEIDNLLPLIENPVKSSILVVIHKEKKLNQRSKLSKAFNDNGVVFESVRLYENKVADWIRSYSQSIGLNISDSAAELMSELLSNDLSKIDNELQKLKITHDGKSTISIEKVRQNIGLNREFTIFELNKSIGKGDLAKSIQILNMFSNNPGSYPNILIIGALFSYFTKILICSENIKKSELDLAKILGISPMFVKEYKNAAAVYPRQKLIEVFSVLKEYDLRSKGLNSNNTSQSELLKEMIIKLMIHSGDN